MTGPLRLGVLGSGDVVRRRTLPALRTVPELTLAAVGSRERARAEALTSVYGGRALGGYQQVVDHPEVDAVYVALPNALHAEWATRALLAGKHVLVEKPLATGLDEAEELVGLARERGLHLVEAFMFLHHPQHRAVRDLVARGAVGDVREVTCDFGIPPRPAGDIRWSAALGGGALLDAGVYPLRAATSLLGIDLEVVGTTRRIDPDHGVDVAGYALLVAPDGVSARIGYGFEHRYRSTIAIWGSEGRLELDRAFAVPPDHVPSVRISTEDGRRTVELPPADQFARMLASFAETVGTAADPRPEQASILRQAALVSSVRRHADRESVAVGGGSW